MLTADDDHAAAIVARAVGADKEAKILEERSKSYKNLWNKETGFMEARNYDGSWAGDWAGWVEGDHWAYTLDVMVSPYLAVLTAARRTRACRTHGREREVHRLRGPTL